MISNTARVASLLSILHLTSCFGYAQEGWWMREPIRLVQTNRRETDSALDPARLAPQLAEFKANVLLFGMGGIVSHYPTNAKAGIQPSCRELLDSRCRGNDALKPLMPAVTLASNLNSS